MRIKDYQEDIFADYHGRRNTDVDFHSDASSSTDLEYENLERENDRLKVNPTVIEKNSH